MTRFAHRRTVFAAALTGLITTASLLAGPASPAQAAPGDPFDLEALPDGGARVTLHLDAPLPVGDAVPELLVDGEVIGAAKESPDGLSLSVETTDTSVLGASSVDVTYNGAVPGSASARRSAPRIAAESGTFDPTLLDVDPGTPGKWSVERLDYDLGDTATTLSGLQDLPVELRAAVYAPKGLTGERPVVIFQHGRHSACYNPVTRGTNNTNWPCATGFQPIQSYLGYTETAEALASHGYIVVSVSANGINAKDASFTDDNGAVARGQLVLKHLDLLAAFNKDKSSPLRQRLNLKNIGLMGHSRGGEGVVEAALLNAALPKPYGIKAVLPLTPVDFGRPTLPDVPMTVLLPYCDGDVSNQQGQHFYDDTRYSIKDNALRSSLMIMGTNHNFFNTEWTPGASIAPSNDDWSPANDEVCGSTAPTRLTPAEQRAVGTAYMAGFFRLVQGGEEEFLPLFDGTNGTVASTGRAVVYAQAQQPRLQRLDVATLEKASPAVTATGFDLAAYCYSVAARTLPGDTPCSATTATSKIPHWTPATFAPSVPISPVLRLQWSAASAAPVLTVNSAVDADEYDSLTFRAARDETAVGAVDLDVTVVDRKGRTDTVRVSDVSPALDAFPASTNTSNGIARLGKTWLRTVNLPLKETFGDVDLDHVAKIEVKPASASGGVYLSDLALDTKGVGGGDVRDAAQVSLADTTVSENAGTAVMQLTLNEKLREPAVINVQTAASGSATAGQVVAQWIPVTVPAGVTTATISVPLVDNTTINTASLRYKITISAPTGVAIGDGFAWLTVLDNDAA